MELTTIQIKKETREKLKKLGVKGETYDAVIARLVDFYDTKTDR
jgi:hypothetical protein